MQRTMGFVIFGLGVFFFLLGFILNERNARYLLAGYNTASAEERASFRLKPYLRFFRLFHVFLGLSLILLCLFIRSGFGDKAAALFVSIYPILAYSFFVYDSSKYTTPTYQRKHKIAGIFLMIVALLIGTVMIWSYEDLNVTTIGRSTGDIAAIQTSLSRSIGR